MSIAVFRLIPFVLVVGLLGLAVEILLFRPNPATSKNPFQLFSLRIVTGLAAVSLILILAAFTGLFVRWFLISVTLMVSMAACIQWWRGKAKLHLFGYLLFCFALGMASVATGIWSKPYEAIINSSDASLYIAFGFSIANSGGIEYKDPVISQMTPAEKELFYSKEENTYARFRGGVIVRDKTDAIISFGFLPLFSCWLALGILIFGASAFLYLLSFQIIIGSLALYWIGEKLAGPILGVASAVALFFFLPQFYFLRLPFSEGFAQTLFLCGLFTLFNSSSKQNQFLTGVLWGSIFLCRIEVMFTCLISIVLLFTIGPEYKQKWKNYRTMLITFGFFLLLTFYWMLSKRIYLEVWGIGEHYLIKTFWLPFVFFLSDVLRGHPLAGAFVFICISAVLFLFTRRIFDYNINEKLERKLSLAFLLLLIFVFLWLIASSAKLNVLTSHFAWTFVYFRPWMIAMLLCSFALLFFVRKIKLASQWWTILFLLLPPAIFFIARPLIVFEQPLYIRRCIPVVFPLFFVLCLYNWLLLCKTFFKSSLASSVSFVGFVILFTATLLVDTSHLIRTALFAGVIEKIETIGDQLPENALVIMPRNEAGVHLELPLQYSLNRDTLTIPDQSFQPQLESFLKRQLEQKRPVYLLTTKKYLPMNPLPDSTLEQVFKGEMIYSSLSPSKPDVVPNRTRKEVLRYQGFKIVPSES